MWNVSDNSWLVQDMIEMETMNRAWDVVTRHTGSFSQVPYLIIPHHTLSYLTLSYLGPSHRYLTLSYLIIPDLTLPYLTWVLLTGTLPHHTLSYLILPDLILPGSFSQVSYLIIPDLTWPYLTWVLLTGTLPHHTLSYLILPYLILPGSFSQIESDMSLCHNNIGCQSKLAVKYGEKWWQTGCMFKIVQLKITSKSHITVSRFHVLMEWVAEKRWQRMSSSHTCSV